MRRRLGVEGDLVGGSSPGNQPTVSRVRFKMLNVVEKKSQFIGTYYCVYLGDWLVLQTKNSKIAHLCGSGNPPVGLITKKGSSNETETEKVLETESAA